MEAGKQVKEFGKQNDLVKRIAEDKTFGLTEDEIMKALNPNNLCGRAMHQVDDFIDAIVNPILERYGGLINDINVEVNV